MCCEKIVKKEKVISYATIVIHKRVTLYKHSDLHVTIIIFIPLLTSGWYSYIGITLIVSISICQFFFLQNPGSHLTDLLKIWCVALYRWYMHTFLAI